MARGAKRKVAARVVSAEAEGAGVWIRFAPISGSPREVVDFLRFSPRDDPRTVDCVGRFLRVLRAGRVRAPSDPYRLGEAPERAAELARRCEGALVRLHLARRMERGLTLWTELGVEKIDRVIDFSEEGSDLAIRRRGSATLIRIPRRSLIRYTATSSESYEVRAVELA